MQRYEGTRYENKKIFRRLSLVLECKNRGRNATSRNEKVWEETRSRRRNYKMLKNQRCNVRKNKKIIKVEDVMCKKP